MVEHLPFLSTSQKCHQATENFIAWTFADPPRFRYTRIYLCFLMCISIRDDTSDTPRTSLRGVYFIGSSNNNRRNSTGTRRTPAATVSVLLRLGMGLAVFVSMSDATAFYLGSVAPTTGPPPAPAPAALQTRPDQATSARVAAPDAAIIEVVSALPNGTPLLLAPRDQLVINTIDHKRGIIAQRTAARIAELRNESSSTPSTPPRRVIGEFADGCSPNAHLLNCSRIFERQMHSQRSETSASSLPSTYHLLHFASLAEHDNGSPIIQHGFEQRNSRQRNFSQATDRPRQDLQRDSGTKPPPPIGPPPPTIRHASPE
jgi:hypothetical protein